MFVRLYRKVYMKEIEDFKIRMWELGYTVEELKLTCNEPYQSIAAASWKYKPLPKEIKSDFGIIKIKETPPKVKEVIS